MPNIPSDPAILLSYVNTLLRDEYGSLDDLCAALGITPSDLCQRLSAAGFEYNADQNRFW